MIKSGHDPRFAVEALHEGCILGEVLERDLDCHDAIEADLLGLVDFAHPALAQLFDQPEIAQAGSKVFFVGILAGHDVRVRALNATVLSLVKSSGALRGVGIERPDVRLAGRGSRAKQGVCRRIEGARSAEGGGFEWRRLGDVELPGSWR